MSDFPISRSMATKDSGRVQVVARGNDTIVLYIMHFGSGAEVAMTRADFDKAVGMMLDLENDLRNVPDEKPAAKPKAKAKAASKKKSAK